MAANGLVANPSKAAFLLLNDKKKSSDEENTTNITFNIGNVDVKRESAAKLLGMKFEENLKWNEHIHGKGGVGVVVVVVVVVEYLFNNILKVNLLQ